MPLFVPGIPKSNNTGSAPLVGSDNTLGYSIGSQWIDSSATPDAIYHCTDASTGAAVWQLTNNAASSPGLILIEKKAIGSAVTTVTFTGLDGNTDGIYILESLINPATATNTQYYLNPNGTTTGQGGSLIDMGVAYNQSALTRFQFSYTFAGAGGIGQAFSTTKLWARAVGPGAQPLRRRMVSTIQTGGQEIRAAANWSDTSTNITSLEIESITALEITVGTTFALYKLDI